jgi:hypothetical protein
MARPLPATRASFCAAHYPLIAYLVSSAGISIVRRYLPMSRATCARAALISSGVMPVPADPYIA